ncbi:hypothetical protein FRUB_09794 [Fimbriiglobus ruber]|uniref:Uncharacterized protein n=1 Tax=Fimbriiglobus ruber TaxID=1908690 RepID=A0A225D0B8_9BACT|nr:hypothetical protein FRUB_09794 [Fimbriiglobus ruber]
MEYARTARKRIGTLVNPMVVDTQSLEARLKRAAQTVAEFGKRLRRAQPTMLPATTGRLTIRGLAAVRLCPWLRQGLAKLPGKRPVRYQA